MMTRRVLCCRVSLARNIDCWRRFGTTAYSLGSWSGKVGKKLIEIDEVYVAVDKHGRRFIVPIQATGGKDQHGIVQTAQDIAWCQAKMPHLICRPISVQFVSSTKIAMLEVELSDDDIIVAAERHYELVPAKSITEEDLKNYSVAAMSEKQFLS